MSERAPSIIENIAARSEADAKRVVQIAERIAEREEAVAKKAAEERSAAAVRELEEAAASQKAVAASQSQAEAERRKLAFRQGLVERLLAESLTRLKTLPRDDAYFAVMERLAGEAASQMPVKEAVLSVSAQDRDFLSGGRFDALASGVKSGTGVSLTLSKDAINAAGGVVLSSSDGKVSVYNTFDEIAYRRRSELKGLIAQELFG